MTVVEAELNHRFEGEEYHSCELQDWTCIPPNSRYYYRQNAKSRTIENLDELDAELGRVWQIHLALAAATRGYLLRLKLTGMDGWTVI